MHIKRCRMRPDVLAEAELRAEEGWSRPPPVADWEHCPNCGEQYGKIAIQGHVRKCRKLRPHGANGYGPGAAQGAAKQSAANLVARAESHADRMRAIFDRFDVDKDGVLSREELATCIRQCFPSRPDDAASLVADFDRADVDKSGSIDFEEFVAHHNELASTSTRFDQAADMFKKFDVNKDGFLSKDEFLSLLNQIFPEHCDEVDEIFEREWAVADADGSGEVSYDEFCRYFDRLLKLFQDEEEPDDAELDGELVPCDGCSLTFLPSKLEEHRRSCAAVKALEEAKAAQDEAEAKLKAALAELDAAKAAAAAATTQAAEDAAAAAAAAAGDASKAAEATRRAAEAEARRRAQEEAAAAKRAAAVAAKDAADREAAEARAAGVTDSFTPSAFVACADCGRKFFPDRLPVHKRVCSKRKVSGIRATTTDGALRGSVYVTSIGNYGSDVSGM